MAWTIISSPESDSRRWSTAVNSSSGPRYSAICTARLPSTRDGSAPMGRTDKVYSFDEARDFIVENFNKFSPELGTFARRAFDNNWIDGFEGVLRLGDLLA